MSGICNQEEQMSENTSNNPPSNIAVHQSDNLDKEIYIYPNPGSKCFTLKTTDKFDVSKEMKLFLYNIHGKLIESKNIYLNNKFCFTRNINSGIYFLKYTNGEFLTGIIKVNIY